MEKSKKVLGVAVAILVVTAGVMGCYVYDRQEEKENSIVSQANVNNVNSGKNCEVATDSTTESAWDKLWSIYTSTQGISFKYPKQIVGIGCRADDDVFYVPTVVFEDKDNGGIYIAPEYYYEYPTDNNGNLDTTKSCQKIMSSLDTVGGKAGVKTDYDYQGYIFGGWSIAIREVKNQDELKNFVKDMYGAECELEDQESAIYNNDTYEYKVKATDMEGDCPMNFSYEMLYNKTKNKVFSISFGQEATFNHSIITDQQDESYDDYMSGSIKFN